MQLVQSLCKPVGCWSISCLVSLFGDFLLCLVLAGRLNSSGSHLLHVILSLEDMVWHEQYQWISVVGGDIKVVWIMQNSIYRISFGTGCSERQLIDQEMCKILLWGFLSALVVVKLTRMRKKYSRFENFPQILSMVQNAWISLCSFLFTRSTREFAWILAERAQNLHISGQNSINFVYFWVFLILWLQIISQV